MAYPHFDLVQRAYNELIAEGKIKQRATTEEVEQDKGLVTRRAGYYTYSERTSAIGILEKTTGNNSMGYSTDILIQTDGDYWDVVTESAGMVQPLDGGPSHDAELIPLWRIPTAELAQVSTSPTPEPTPPPSSGVTLDDVMATLHTMQQTAANDSYAIQTHTTAETERVLQRLNELRQEVIDFAEIAGKVLLVAHHRRQEEEQLPEEPVTT